MSAIKTAPPVRSSRFYIDDRMPFVILQVEGQLFRVHRYLFELESELFKSMFEIPQGGNQVEGETDESPIFLPSVSVAEIEVLLKYFYFRQGLQEAKFTRIDWCNLLSISHRYECKCAHARSIIEIKKLDPPLGDATKIAMSKKFGVDEWLLPACVALVERKEPLSYVEAEKLGLEITVLLCEAREKFIRPPRVQTLNTLYHVSVPKQNAVQIAKEVLNIR